MQIFDLLRKTVLLYPDNNAVIHHDKKITYRQLADASVKVAEYLGGVGIEKGGRVAILFENSIEYVILFLGILKAGYVVVPLDTSLTAKSLVNIINDCQPEVLAFQARFRRIYHELTSACPSLKSIISDKDISTVNSDMPLETIDSILVKSRAFFENADVHDTKLQKNPKQPHQLAAIFYTSGSTGTSKGVMLSHLNLVSNTIGTIEYLKLKPQDSVIVILPFYYIYGNSLLLTHVATGGTLVIDNRFMYPEVILDTMEKEKVTGFSGVPSNFMILLNKSTFTERKFKYLRYFTQAGGAMAPEVIKKLLKAFPEKEIYIMYGQTEASPRVSYLPPERLKEKVGSIGIPVPGVKISILSEHGQEVGEDEVGEIVVSGDNVMMGYWNQPEEQEEVLKNGSLYTGDLARKDREGLIYIVGRKKEIIKTGGNRVSAKEVEECLLENETVMEAAVFGVDDPLLGEAIRAAVVLKENCKISENELRHFCKAKMADHKVPKKIEFLKSLPKYKTGKVNKILLKETS